MAEDAKTAEDAAKFHRVMGLLLNLQMAHGTCHPRERRACTNCNARDDLNQMIAEYNGAPVKLQSGGLGHG